MVIAVWEMEYNGLIFGGAQTIGVVSVEGLDPPDFKVDDTPKTGAHGSIAFAQFYHARRIVIEGDIHTSGTLETFVNTLRSTFAVRTNDIAFTWQLPGVNRRRTMCRPTRIKIPMSPPYDIGSANWFVELIAQDPSIYDDTTGTKIYDG